MTKNKLYSLGWTSHDRSWFTHPTHGGIVKEHDRKWWLHPWVGTPVGPFDTMDAAVKSAVKVEA